MRWQSAILPTACAAGRRSCSLGRGRNGCCRAPNGWNCSSCWPSAASTRARRTASLAGRRGRRCAASRPRSGRRRTDLPPPTCWSGCGAARLNQALLPCHSLPGAGSKAQPCHTIVSISSHTSWLKTDIMPRVAPLKPFRSAETAGAAHPAEIDREIAMTKVIEARAFCNNEVAYLAWKTDGKIKDCLGFMITRINLDTDERRLLPAWVAFNTQSNPKFEEQDTSVWPIQKFSWRDLSLRRSRNTLQVRAPFRAKYEIVPVGPEAPGRVAVPSSPTAQPGKYKGDPIPMFVCGEAGETNEFSVTDNFGDVSAFFNNGILSTQNLPKQLETKDGEAPPKPQIDAHIKKPGDPIRTFLAGDVLPALKSMFTRAEQVDGTLHLALYELEDTELVDLLVQNQARLNLILSTAGSKTTKAKPASMPAAAKAMVKRSKLVKNATKKKSIATMAKKSAKKVSAAKKAGAMKKAAKKAVKRTTESSPAK